MSSERDLILIQNDYLQKTLLGCYEHFYNDNFKGNSKFGTHYVVLSFVIKHECIKKVAYVDIDVDQHRKYIWFDLDKDDASNLKINKP